MAKLMDSDYYKIMDTISNWPDWKLDSMCLDSSDLKIKEAVIRYREIKQRLGKWITFTQDGMVHEDGKLIILHGEVISAKDSYLIVKCKNGVIRYVSNSRILGTYDSKYICYKMTEVDETISEVDELIKNLESKHHKKIRYMRCEKCGKLLKEGSIVIEDEQCVGAYCDIACWAESKGHFNKIKLTDEIVKENWGLKEWDKEE